MPASDEEPTGWTRIWSSLDGSIWNVLTEAEFKQFPLEQLALHWADGRGVLQA